MSLEKGWQWPSPLILAVVLCCYSLSTAVAYTQAFSLVGLSSITCSTALEPLQITTSSTQVSSTIVFLTSPPLPPPQYTYKSPRPPSLSQPTPCNKKSPSRRPLYCTSHKTTSPAIIVSAATSFPLQLTAAAAASTITLATSSAPSQITTTSTFLFGF